MTITKIALITGHNAKSQGAWWRGQNKALSEFSFANDLISELLKQAQDIKNLELKHFIRKFSGGYCKEMREVHRRIDHWGANITVEYHFNAGGKTAKGHEVLHYNCSTGGKIIAAAMNKAFNKHLFNRDRGRKPVGVGERGSYGLKVGKARSILVEPFFKKELPDFIQDGKHRSSLINAYVDFFREVVALDGNTKALSPEKRPVTHQPNIQLTKAELQYAMELLA